MCDAMCYVIKTILMQTEPHKEFGHKMAEGVHKEFLMADVYTDKYASKIRKDWYKTANNNTF